MVLALLMAWPAGLAWAQDCDQPENQSQMDECVSLRYKAAEREMGAIWAKLMKSDDQDLKNALQQSQDAWLNWREAEGNLVTVTVSDTTLAVYERLKVQSQLTEDRIKDLRGYVQGQ